MDRVGGLDELRVPSEFEDTSSFLLSVAHKHLALALEVVLTFVAWFRCSPSEPLLMCKNARRCGRVRQL